MKKITFLLVAIMATMFCACSSDNDNAPENSQFIYADNSILISITRGPTFGITIFKNGECAYQNLYNVTVSGEYPIYTYIYKDSWSNTHLKFTGSYSSPSTFTAIVELCEIIGQHISPHYKGQTITLPSTMVFKADNRVLDVNGDGLLDEIFSQYN